MKAAEAKKRILAAITTLEEEGDAHVERYAHLYGRDASKHFMQGIAYVASIMQNSLERNDKENETPAV